MKNSGWAQLCQVVAISALLSQSGIAEVHDHRFVANLDKAETYLYDHKNHQLHYVASKGKYLAHRVYIRYEKSLHQWCYLKTDLNGLVPSPIEYLRPDSVTFGRVVGGAIGLQRFRLGDDGDWKPTRESEVYRVWIPGEKPILKAYVYKLTKPPAKPQIPALRVPTEVPQRSQR